MTTFRFHLLLAALLVAGSRLVLAEPAEVKSPLSPEESLKHFQLDPLLSIELVAAEPEVIDPVAMRFDEDGRLWVAEMRDYPLGPIKKTDGKRTEKDAEALSQIKILEDKNGDGRFETATVFADKLLFVTGLQPWKGGVIVTLSGKVAYMKDTDGDGKADVNETWFTGFSESNSQLRANHPTFALDNHIYIANGLRGGMVVNHLKKLLESGGRKPPDEKESGVRGQESEKKDDAPINISGMDFRFDPLTGEAEAVSGNGQFGLCFDDWANRFVCSNRNPCQHVVIENRYLKKAPTVAIPAVVQDVAAFGENSRIYPISKFWTTSNLHEGQFTAACGVFIYRGDLLPEQFRGNVFTCDPTGNLIHREIMEAKGPTFTSKPAYEGKEFLASPDTWFRPVSMELGPDGALYVVDMYRAVIEHPEWVPDELKNRPDERLGDDRGRIYRIVPKASEPAPASRKKTSTRLSQVTSDELATKLENSNAWHRESAQRLILERNELTNVAHVQAVFNVSKSPLGKSHALWTLAAKNPSYVEPALRDPNPLVRRQAIIALEPVLEGFPRDVIDRMLLRDDDMIVCWQATLARTPLHGATPVAAVFRMIREGSEDPWVRNAYLLACSEEKAVMRQLVLKRIVSAKKDVSPGYLLLSETVAAGLGSDGDDATIAAFLTLIQEPLVKERPTEAVLAIMNSFSQGLARRGKHLGKLLAADEIANLRDRVAELAADGEAPIPYREKAIDLLGFLPESARLLANIADGEREQQLRVVAIRACARQENEKVWGEFVKGIVSTPPAIRQAIIEGTLQRPERISLLFDSLESGTIKPTELDPVQTGRLLKHGDAKIRERAEKIFGSATPEDRKKALADYQAVLAMTGDAKRGQVSFAKNCATCHKIGETGVNVAPDISDSRTKTASQILADIIQPNRAIDANYVAYSLLLADGTTASGILTAETSTSITLKAAGAKVITVARGEIEQLKSTGVSLMPDGLEKTIPPQEMADLISFIKNWRYLDGRVPVK